MCVCEKFVARVPLVYEFFLHKEFSGTFFDSADAPFCVAISPWGSYTGIVLRIASISVSVRRSGIGQIWM